MTRYTRLIALSLCLAACGGQDNASKTDTAQTAPEFNAQDGPQAAASPQAVTPDPVAVVPKPPAATPRYAQIDWAAAQADMAAAGGPQTRMTTATADDTPPPVPLLLPPSNTSVQTVGPRGGAPSPQALVMLQDGYFATVPGATYDIIINGTNIIADLDGKTKTRSETPRFAFTSTGAEVTLSRYGADYLIQFECRDAIGEDNCITEADALALADKLTVQGTN